MKRLFPLFNTIVLLACVLSLALPFDVFAGAGVLAAAKRKPKYTIEFTGGNVIVNGQITGETYTQTGTDPYYYSPAGTYKEKIYYGITWNETTDAYTRTGNLAGIATGSSPGNTLLPIQELMKRCVLNDDLTVNYYLDPTDSTLKANGDAAVLDGTDGQVVVEIPKFWYKYTYSAPEHSWEVATWAKSGFSVHPAFVSGGTEHDYIYIGAYEGSMYDATTSAMVASGDIAADLYAAGDILCSISGQYPKTYETRAEFRAMAEARGTGWQQQDFYTTSALQLLYLTEYGDFDSQATIGAGRTQLTGGTWAASSYIGISGLSNGDGNATGVANYSGDADDAGADAAYVSYRGVENLYGNVWAWVDGLNVYNDGASKAYACDDWSDFADDTATNYTLITSSLAAADGYARQIAQIADGFLPASVSGGSSSIGLADYYYTYFDTDDGSVTPYWRVARVGGSANLGASAGAFYWISNDASSDATASVGGRLCARVSSKTESGFKNTGIPIETVGGMDAFKGWPNTANLLLDSLLLDSWSENNDCTGYSVPVTATGADGTADAAYVLTDASASASSLAQTISKSATDTKPVTFLVFFKKTTGTPSTYPAVQISFAGVVTKYVMGFVDTTNGTITLEATGASSAANMVCGIFNAGDYWGAWVSATDNASNTSIVCVIGPAKSDDGSTQKAATTGSCTVDLRFCGLYYNQSFPGVPIDNSGAALATMEDLSGYNETDPASRMEVYGTNTVKITDLDKDEDCYLFKASATSTATGFTHRVHVNFSECDTVNSFYFWALTSADDDLYDIDVASGTWFGLVFAHSPLGTYKISISRCLAGSLNAVDDYIMSLDTDYYITIDITTGGTYGTLRARIYSDSSRETLLDTLTYELIDNYTFTHVGMSAYNSAATSGAELSGTISNLTLTSGSPELVTGGDFADVTETNSWTSDFSVDIDNFSGGNGTRAGNIDGIAGEDNCLRFVVNGDNSIHYISKGSAFDTDKAARLRCKIYLPSGNSNVDQVRVYDGSIIGHYMTTTDSWTEVDFYAYTNTTAYYLQASDGGIGTFQDSGAGPELITNGTLDADLSDWDDNSTGDGSFAFDTDHAELDANTGTAQMGQTITVVAHNNYTLTFDVAENCTGLTVTGGTSAYGGTEHFTELFDSTGSKSISFFAAGTSVYLNFSSSTDEVVSIDNVSLKQGYDVFYVKDVIADVVTFTNFTAGTGWKVGVSSESLSGKAQKVAGTASALEQNISATAYKSYRTGAVITCSAGSANFEVGGVNGAQTISASGTYYDYHLSTGTGNLKVEADATFAGTVDSLTCREHGTVVQGNLLKFDLLTGEGLEFAETLGGELLPNPTFDANTTGWDATNATLASVAGGQSNNCLEITRTDGDYQVARENKAGLTIGTLYKTSVYVKSGTSGNEAYTVTVQDGSNYSTIATIAGTSSGSWVKVNLYFQATYTTMRILLIKDSATAGTMLFDEASFKEVTNARSDGTHPLTQTAVVWWRPGFDHGQGTAGGILNCYEDEDGLIKHNTANKFNSYDDTTTAQSGEVDYSAGDWLKIVLQVEINSNVLQFRLGVDSGGGVSWGSWANHDGRYPFGSYLNILYNTFGPAWIGKIDFYDYDASGILDAVGSP